MSFGRKLALPLIGILLLVQAAAGIALYYGTRAAVREQFRTDFIATSQWILHQTNPEPSLPPGVELVIADGTSWRPVSGNVAPAVLALVPSPGAPLPADPSIVTFAGEDFLLQAMPIPGQPKQALVMVHSLSLELRHFRFVWLVLTCGLSAVLATALIAARLIDRGFARPIGRLAAQIAQIGRGDYTLPPTPPARDEIGQKLSMVLTNMTQAIADREYRIRDMALHEPVTHLPNRAAFLDVITPQLGVERAAFLVVGLVHAQEIANTVGRDVADRVMRNAAIRLRHLLGDASLACLGDRSFAAFLPKIGELRARSIAARIVTHFEAPYNDADLTIDTTSAVGIALLPVHGSEGSLLLRRAEVALQEGLRSEHRWAVYDPASDPHRPERLSLMSDLRQGLGRNEFMLVYQPKLHVPSGRVTGAEALVRWHHPRRGIVSPDEFIGLAEDTGNIGHVTRWALRAGIAQAAKWRDEGIGLQIAINISARDLSDSRLPDRVVRLLEEYQLNPEAISLEVTESAIMTNPSVAIAVLHQFAERGIGIAVDDFGVGRASLAYLRTLPVRELKIDKTFIERLTTDANDGKIVRSVIELGHSLGFAVSVEGVEDAATLAVLAELGCDYVQGYFIARPLVAEMLATFVRQPPPGVPA